MKEYVSNFIDENIENQISKTIDKIDEYETRLEEDILSEDTKEWYHRQIKIKEEQLGFLKELKNDLIKKYFGE